MSANSVTLLQCYNNTQKIDQLYLKFNSSYSDNFNIFTDGDVEGGLLTTPDNAIAAAYMRILGPDPGIDIGIGSTGATTLTLDGDSLAQRSYRIQMDKKTGGNPVPGGHSFFYIEYNKNDLLLKV